MTENWIRIRRRVLVAIYYVHGMQLLLLLLLLLLRRIISLDVLSSLISLPFANLRYFLSLLLAFVVLPVVDALVVAQTV